MLSILMEVTSVLPCGAHARTSRAARRECAETAKSSPPSHGAFWVRLGFIADIETRTASTILAASPRRFPADYQLDVVSTRSDCD
ncbi:MAG TPA: hypothetical protein VK597_01230 [Inquilinus sp.]|nr:hypothetical protein [Inquilinus sp.]